MGSKTQNPLANPPRLHALSPSAPLPQPCFLFVGERFEAHPDFALAKSLLLDLFRGEAVDELNLMGLDHVMAAYAPDDKTLILRTYHISLKRSGTRVSKVGWRVGVRGAERGRKGARSVHPA